ncbi:MAG: acyl-ACP--UDP-N-acetylglucosamine O-acyltransferase [Candidatus Binatia bacterium]|nr:acyl-ACP--UDP-N-acetylglucosamine O-acyltransferase [Candidatus Binatia bacterium]
MLSGRDISRLLPHRYPFLLVDRVVEFEADRRIVAVKNVTLNEPHFSGHFPDRPIMPGVLLCEAMAQAGGLLVQGTHRGGLSVDMDDDGEGLFLVLTGLDNVKFRRQVLPGDQVQLEVTLQRKHRPLWKMRGVASVDGQVVAQADLSAVEVESEAAAGEPVAPAPRTQIHSTAIVSVGAELEAGVEVGPQAFIGPRVRIGRGTKVQHHAHIDGCTTLGVHNQVFPYAVVGSVPQDMKYAGEDSRLTIGDRNRIREFATLSLGTEGGGMETTIGDDNLFMNYSHVGHDCHIGSHAILVNSSALAGHIDIGDFAIVSGLSAIAQFVRVGESAFIGGGSMVVMDVPPYCMANGNRAELKGLNQVGLERRGITADQVRELKRAYKLLFSSKMRVAEAVKAVHKELADSAPAKAMAEFVAASERGVTRP